MTPGGSHPDDRREEGPDGPPDSRSSSSPSGTWTQAANTELTTPPSSSVPLADDPSLPGFPSHPTIPSQRLAHGGAGADDSFESPLTIPSQRIVTGEAGSDESIGVQGPLQPGQVLFGRYRAEKLLGEGGMGTVWLVKHLELDTLRALKLIISGIAFDPGAQARFKREARVMARLSHPNAVVVHDAKMGRDAAFIEMEYIRGLSLNRRSTAGVPMPLDWTARILEQLCDVLEEAHAQKIVHRDLKPANLMLLDGRPVGREQLKVLDFGIAKILEGETAGVDVHTNTGNFLGSAPYTSPEQASGTGIDARSDLYSVGVILYELLTGYRPFTGPITRIIYDHLYSTPPPFGVRNPAVKLPPEVERVVQRCLAKHPADRPPSARALCEEFLQALPESVRNAVPSSPASPSSPSDLPRTEHDPVHRSTPAPSSEPLPWSSPGDRAVAPPTENATRGISPLARSEAFPQTQGLAAFQPPLPFPPLPPSPPLSPSDWDRPAVAPEKLAPGATRRRGRKVLAAVALALIVAIVAAAVLRGLVRPGRPAGPPAGYAAADAADLVAGSPRVLVRQRDGARFFKIAGGSFKMGNDFDRSAQGDDEDQPAHPVTLSDFYIQETEVTNAEMLAYFVANRVDVAKRPARWKAAWELIETKGHDPARYPAVGIPHDLAEAFAHWAGGALTTEAQWEYAARSRGKPYPYVWGTEPMPDPKLANVDSIGLIGSLPTAEVGKYPRDRTEQGVLDLTGNVREWCRDAWSAYPASTEPVVDPHGPAASASAGPVDFVVRGGSFAFWKDWTRTTRPRRPQPDDLTAKDLARDGSADDLGFRIVLEWPRPR